MFATSGFRIVVVVTVGCIFPGMPAMAQVHSADTDANLYISLSELLRVIQFFNSSGFHCETGTEDGFAPGSGDQSCTPHDSDYNTQDWHINLSELLRVIQFFNSGGYTACPSQGTEDGFCPEAGGEGEGLSEGEGAAEGEEATVYFVVANPDNTAQGAYVLPLNHPGDIAHARAVIASPESTSAHIAVARIAEGGTEGSYTNCDPLNGDSLWSWRITEFLGFADVTAEIYDGWAAYLEEHLAEWLSTTGDQIGFWTYRVVSELAEPCQGAGEGEGEGQGEGEGVIEGEGVEEGEIEGEEEVVFPDPGLEAAVREALRLPMGPIYASALAGLTQLDASGFSIVNLAEIEHCVNLVSLDLGENQIVELAPLAALTGLTHLNLNTNQIVDVSPLTFLTNLVVLRLEWNQIVNTSPLGELTGLTTLTLDRNQIVDTGPLTNLTNLTVLGLSWNQIANLGPLGALDSLTGLNLSGNQIVELSPLAPLSSLMTLSLDGNQIVNIGPLTSLSGLVDLNLSYNMITDIAALVSNSGLGSGDTLNLINNFLSEDACGEINTLKNRGVWVSYDPYCPEEK